MNWKIAAVLVATLACLAWVLWGLDLAVVRESLRAFHPWVLLPMGALYLSAHAVRCLRLRLLLGVPVPFWSMLSLNSVGFLAINVIPLRLGEFVRPTLLHEREGVPFGASLAAIFVERLLDMLSLLVMLLLVGVVVALPPGGISVAGVDIVRAGQAAAGATSLAGLLGIGAVLVAGEPAVRLAERVLALAHPDLARRAAGFVRHFRDALLDLARRPAQALPVLVLTVLVWTLTVAGLWCVLAGMPGLDLGLAEAMVVWALTLAAFTAVPTPGFLGSHEAGCSAALRLLGVEPSLAVTVAVLIHAGQLGFTIGVGLFFTLWEGISLRELLRRARTR